MLSIPWGKSLGSFSEPSLNDRILEGLLFTFDVMFRSVPLDSFSLCLGIGLTSVSTPQSLGHDLVTV